MLFASGDGLQAFAFEPLQDEVIHLAAGPIRFLDARALRAQWCNERPMFLPLGPLIGPASDQSDLAIAQLVLAQVLRWHADCGIAARDLPHHLAVRRIAANDCEAAAGQLDKGPGFGVKAQLGLAIRLVRAMTSETLVGKDRPNVTVELDYIGKVRRCARRGAAERGEQQGRDEQPG